MLSEDEYPIDEGLYDEDGLLKEEDTTDFKDKSKLISSVHKIFDIKKTGRGALRREAVKDAEEFIAVKRRSGAGSSSLNKLLESVKSSGGEKTVDKVSKLVKAPSLKSIKTLETPLEKPQALKAKRTVLYDNAKKDVSRFNAIVYHNRVADQLVFPLNAGKKALKQSAKERVADSIPMTPLEEEMARVLYGEEYVQQKKSEMAKPRGPSDAEAYALSVEEALNMHSEMARLRAQQSYKMAKAKRQNKIKSKKYHRLLRKEKIRKQLKEFEELQKKDPESAMLKLEELNKSRVEERMSLKHRNTSKWAKMHAARAKYNKDSRIALSEQLKISKDLTQKVEEESSDDDDLECEIPHLVKSSLDNPWMLKPEVRDNEKLALYYSGYKKLWEQINDKKEKDRKRQELLLKPQEDDQEKHVKKLDDIDSDNLLNNTTELDIPSTKNVKIAADQPNNNKPLTKKAIARKEKKKLKQKEKADAIISAKANKKKNKVKNSTEDKDFTELDLDIMIEEAEDKIKNEVEQQIKKLSKEERVKKREALRQAKRFAKKQELKKNKSKQMMKGDEDEIQDLELDSNEQLLEEENRNNNHSSSFSSTDLLASVPSKKEQQQISKMIIDPNNYLKISKKSSGALKKKAKFDGASLNQMEFDAFDEDLVDSGGDEGDEEDGGESDQRKLIAEAFEDDDVVDEFRKRKQDEIDALMPKDIDLSLPGWGEWGGNGIVVNPKKRKRFVIKAKPAPPRKDAQLSHVILNSEAGEKMKDHLVRELPFPFKRVKDYEKTIRAPVGRTWLPEQATRDMTAPKVITRLGAIISPLDEDVLVKTKSGGAKDLKVPISIKRLARVKK